MHFRDLGLCEPLLRAVAHEGYNQPTPIQAQAIPHVLAGSDLLGSAQTGTGKTAAFALPVLHRLCENPPLRNMRRRVRVLVLSPTRELALQIGESFATYGRHTPIRHTVIFGGVSQFHQVRALRQGVDVLVATPGRLVDLLNQGLVDLSGVEIFILDEADRMLDIGFLPDIRRVIARLPEERQTLFFSATMPDAVADLADSILDRPERVAIAPVKETTELIDQSVYFVPQKHKAELLAGYLTTQPVARAVVFTRTKHGADRLTRHLTQAGVKAEAIHGNKSQNARQGTLARFKNHRIHVLVATDLAARGIDVEGITHVFNFELPHDPETYVHRIGRTGRAGATGIAISLCDLEERKHLKAIERLTRKPLVVQHTLPEGLSDIPLTPPREERRTDTRPARPSRNGRPTGKPVGGARPARRPGRSGRGYTSGAAARSETGPVKKRRRFAPQR